MTDDKRLTQRLTEAIPPAPDTSEWAAAARRGSIRRRTVSGGLVTAVVLAAAAALVSSQLPGSTIAVPALTPSPAPVDLCLSNPEPGGLDRNSVPIGAVGVTLCAGKDPTYNPPPDALTQNVDALARSYNEAPAWKESGSEDCQEGFHRTFRLVFAYPDGRAAVVLADGFCDRVGTPASWQAGGEGLLSEFRERLIAQRRAGPVAPTHASCPWINPPAIPVDLTTAPAMVLCFVQPDGTSGAPHVLTDVEAAILRPDLIERTSRAHNIDSMRDGPLLTLWSANGDPLVFWRVDGGVWFAFDGDGDGDGDGQLFWRPGDVATALLDQLLAALPASPPVPTGRLGDDPCRDLRTFPREAEVPASAVEAVLCAAGDPTLAQFPPLDVVRGADALDPLLRLYRSLPPATGQLACPANLGPSFVLRLLAPDESVAELEIQLYGCRLVSWNGEHRVGADKLIAAFTNAVSEQRNRVGKPPESPRPGSWCTPGTQVGLLTPPIGDVVAGQVCRRPGDGDPQRVADDDLQELAARLGGSPIDPATCQPVGQGSLVLADSWYDLVHLQPTTCGWLYAGGHDATKTYAWKPNAAALKILAKYGL